MNEMIEVHLRALRDQIEALSVKVEAIATCQRAEIDERRQRLRKRESWLIVVFMAVAWAWLLWNLLSLVWRH